MTTILRVRDLSVGLTGRRSTIQVLSNVDLEVEAGEILGVVGESGCGKSTLIVAVLNLLELPQILQAGEVEFVSSDGKPQDLLKLTGDTFRQFRWRQMAYIPQGSMNALNPVLRVRKQMIETLTQHGMAEREADEQVQLALQMVHLKQDVLDLYSHELSGGMRQRVIIATAISMHPAVLIADEPTTALDVVTQRLILQELSRICRELGITIILVSHDMGVMAEVADRLAVMYAGRIVEIGAINKVFKSSLHPYTQQLIASIPNQSGEHVEGLAGEAPGPWNYPPGCRFHPRCPFVMEICRQQVPPSVEQRPAHWVSCHLFRKEEGSNG
jgi:peptide/nickel transport system ATP-binding protein